LSLLVVGEVEVFKVAVVVEEDYFTIHLYQYQFLLVHILLQLVVEEQVLQQIHPEMEQMV
jgi:hypothetical protein